MLNKVYQSVTLSNISHVRALFAVPSRSCCARRRKHASDGKRSNTMEKKHNSLDLDIKMAVSVKQKLLARGPS